MSDDDLPRRIASKIAPERWTMDTDCWIWKATRFRSGYGKVGFNKVIWSAHRLTYTLLVGPIPDGLDLDHLCRVRACVNPAHLEPVTRRENLARGETIIAAHLAKTHCVRGHPLTSDNLYPSDRGHRICKQCRRDDAKRRYHEHKAVSRV